MANDTGMAEDDQLDQLDLLERGVASLYNPGLLTASKRRSWREGLGENFIRRDKRTMTYVMY